MSFDYDKQARLFT